MVSQKEKINSRISLYLPLLLLILLWGYSLFFIPTFDLDESLYRRAAEEMKRSGNWWLPTWDGWGLYHKPPIYYWLIMLVSYVVDGSAPVVSSLATRIPSFLSSIGILISLFFAVPIITRRPNHPSLNLTSPLMYLAAFFPILTGTAAIFDPMQTLLLMPALILITRYFYEDTLSRKDVAWIAISIFAATALKGLNGILIPGFAFALHGVFSQKRFQHFITALRIFAPATLLSVAFYVFLDQKMGRPFTQEFFLIHHFGRSQEAMETHGGSFLYHPAVLWLGAGFFGLQFWKLLFTTRFDWSKFGFPLTYSLAFIIFFTFSATKLPHYTWPIWAALALQAGLFAQARHSQNDLALKIPVYLKNFLTRVPLLIWGIGFLLLALIPLSVIQNFPTSAHGHLILSYFSGIPLLSKALLFLCSVIWIGVALSKSERFQLWQLACLNLFCGLILATSLIPIAKELLFDPQEKITEIARDQYIKAGDCVRYGGPHSPTISLALGYITFHNRCEPYDAKFLIVPQWKLHECQELKMEVLAQSQYLYLCGRK